MNQYESETKRYKRRLNTLKNERKSQGWDSHWLDLADYFSPHRGRYLRGMSSTEANDGRKKYGNIINGSCLDAQRTLAGGLQGGLTSPSRPWFQLTLNDEDLSEYAPVRNYLHDVRNILLTIMARSNFYGATHNLYEELAVFGTSVMIIDEDPRTVIRCRPMTIGEFSLVLSADYRPEGLFRQFPMRADQMVEKFGVEVVPREVKNAMDCNSPDKLFEVVNVIEPTRNLEPERGDYRGMKYHSCYFPYAGDDDKFLRKGGYRVIPFSAARWQVVAVDTYGICPGMAALGDNRQLQQMEKRKLSALDKMLNPPMNASASLRASGGGSLLPGATNYIGEGSVREGFTPAMQIQYNIREASEEIARVEQRIRRFFFNDLFLTVLNESKQMTAQEVVKRHEEKMVMLGPVLERLQAEFLDVMIDRVFDIAESFGILPEAPKELEGHEMKIEYISLLAQAQKIVSVSTINEFAAFVGGMMAIKQNVADKFDVDEAVDQFGTALGVPPKVIVSDDKVAELRAQREQAARAQQMAAMAQPAKDATAAMKNLGETQTGGERSALENMLNPV